METFSALLAICEGNSPVTGEFPAQRPVTRSFDIFFAWMNGWVNTRDVCDLRRHRAHYDVTVMYKFYQFQSTLYPPNRANTECCHDANFVVTGNTGGCRLTANDGNNDDKIAIMATLSSLTTTDGVKTWHQWR